MRASQCEPLVTNHSLVAQLRSSLSLPSHAYLELGLHNGRTITQLLQNSAYSRHSSWFPSLVVVFPKDKALLFPTNSSVPIDGAGHAPHFFSVRKVWVTLVVTWAWATKSRS